MKKIGDYVKVGDLLVDVLAELKVRDEIPMTRQQAAAYLGVSVSTISNYLSCGKLIKKVKNGISGIMPEDLRSIKK